MALFKCGGGGCKTLDFAVKSGTDVSSSKTINAQVSFPAGVIKAVRLYSLGELMSDGDVTIAISGYNGTLLYSDKYNDMITLATKTVDRTTVASNPVDIDIPVSEQTRENVLIKISGGNWNYAQIAYLRIFFA